MVKGEDRITFLLSVLIILIIVIVFVNRYGTDAIPYSVGLGIAAITAMYFVIKGVSSED